MFFLYLLKPVVFLLFCGLLCVYASAVNELPAQQEVFDKFLEKGQIKLTKTGQTNDITADSINNALLVATNNVMVALASVTGSGDDEGDMVLAKYIETKSNDNWGDEVIKQSGTNTWNTELATTKNKKTESLNTIKSYAVFVKDNKIYYITVSNNMPKEPSEVSGANTKWYVRVVIAKFTGETEAEKKIEWQTTIYSKTENSKLDNGPNIQPKTIPPSDGFAFATSDKKNIIFVMKGRSLESDDKNVVAFFQLEENGGSNKFELFYVKNTANYYPSFFQWEGKIFKTPTDDQDDNNNEVTVFNADNNKFEKSNGSVSCLRDFLKNKNNFVSVTIDNQSLLLFTEQKEKEETKRDVNLWMTDGTRVSCVGTIIENFEEPFYWSVAYTNNELFALHKKYETGKYNKDIYSLTRLKGQLKNIKNILSVWINNNNTINDICQNPAIAVIPCSIDGLVGFLSDSDEKNLNWKNKYLFADATVMKQNGEITKVPHGFTFSGTNVGAQWPVSKSSENQPYNFTDPGFTLIATVSFNSNKEIDVANSVLGIDIKEDKRYGLWCNEKKKWAVSVAGVKNLKESKEECEQGKVYSVALVLGETRNVEIYVNWKKLTGFDGETIKIKKEDNINQFYFGINNNDGKSETTTVSYVTVTNVLLYNRPFTQEEISELQKKQNERNLSKQTNDIKGGQYSNGDEDNDPQTLEISSEESASPLEKTTSQTNTATNEGEVQSFLHPQESAVSLNVNVGVFIVMLVVLFTFGGHYV